MPGSLPTISSSAFGLTFVLGWLLGIVFAVIFLLQLPSGPLSPSPEPSRSTSELAKSRLAAYLYERGLRQRRLN